MMEVNVIVIGAGPAGMSAAVYLARKQLKTLILTKDIGGQAAGIKIDISGGFERLNDVIDVWGETCLGNLAANPPILIGVFTLYHL